MIFFIKGGALMKAMHIKEGQHGPRKICISHSKGGVGKTTTAVNLSGGLALAGFKVLLVDADTQGHVSYMLGVSSGDSRPGLAELLTQESRPAESVVQVRENLSLLAGGKSLAAVKRLSGRQDFGGEMLLADALKKIDTEYDYVLVDTSPGWDSLTVNVLFYAKEVLCPVSLDPLAIYSLAEFLKSITAIRKYNPDLSFKYVVPTFFDKAGAKAMKILAELNKVYGNKVCGPIRHCDSLAAAANSGRLIFEFAPGAPGADDYRSLIRKVAENNNLFR